MTRINRIIFPIMEVIGLFALLGCHIDYPDGKFLCGQNGNCPAGMHCRKDGRCYHYPDTQEMGTDTTDEASTGQIVQVEDSENESQHEDAGATDNLMDSLDGDGFAESDGEIDIDTDRDTDGNQDIRIEGGGAGIEVGGINAIESGGHEADADAGIGISDSGSNNGVETESDADTVVDDSGGVENDSGVSRYLCDNATCTDRETGLQWQRCAAGLRGADCSIGTAEREVWVDAVDRCANLLLADQDDWRLPSIYELVSLVDYSMSNPPIDSDYFPNTPSIAFWSSTDTLRPLENNWVAAWAINYKTGFVSYDQKASTRNPLLGTRLNVRCVRGKKINARTFTRKDRVVLDDTAPFMWQACSAGQIGENCLGEARRYSWQSALEYCDRLDNYANYSDWRLPEIHELLSLVDYTKFNPAIDSIAFPETQSHYYWTSTPIEDYPDNAWYVDFTYGHTKFELGSELRPNTSTSFITHDYYVRCVRDDI